MQKRYGEDWVCRVLVSGRAGMRDLQGVSRSRQHACGGNGACGQVPGGGPGSVF